MEILIILYHIDIIRHLDIISGLVYISFTVLIQLFAAKPKNHYYYYQHEAKPPRVTIDGRVYRIPRTKKPRSSKKTQNADLDRGCSSVRIETETGRGETLSVRMARM